MIGIEAIATYIPDRFIDNRTRMATFDVDEAFLEQKTGMLKVARRAEGEETSDMCCTAVERLVAETGLDLQQVDCVVVCTQNPDACGLPHTSAIVHGKLGLSLDCAVFDISLGCSGYVYGLSIVRAFMESNGFERGLLITADPYSKVLDEDDKNTTLLFGDGATATLLSSTPRWKIGKCVFGSDGSQNAAIAVQPETGKFAMNGRGVFNFTATVVPGNIEKTLTANGLAKADIGFFLLHQGSRYICTTLAKRLKVVGDKVPFHAAEYGNVVSSSVPMMLRDYLDTKAPLLLSGFGVGLSWGSCVLTPLSEVDA